MRTACAEWSEFTLVQGLASWSPRSQHTLTAFNGGLYVIAGYGYFLTELAFFNDVWFSGDGGVTWKVSNFAPFAPRAGHGAAVYNVRVSTAGLWCAQHRNAAAVAAAVVVAAAA